MIALLVSLLMIPRAHAIANLSQEKELSAAYEKAAAGHKRDELIFLAESQDDWRTNELSHAADKLQAYDARTAVLENWWDVSVCKDFVTAPDDYTPFLMGGEHKTVKLDGHPLEIDLAEPGTGQERGLLLPFAQPNHWRTGCTDCGEKIIFHKGKYYDLGSKAEYTDGVRTDRVDFVSVLSARGYQVPICQTQNADKTGEPKLTLNHDDDLCGKFRDHNFTKLTWSTPDVNTITSAPPDALNDSAGADSFTYDGATLRADLLDTKTSQVIGRIQKTSRTNGGCQKQGLALTAPENPFKLQDFKGADAALATALHGLSRELSCQNGQLDVLLMRGHDYVQSQPRKGIRRLYTLKDGRAEMICEVSTPLVREFKFFIGPGGRLKISEP